MLAAKDENHAIGATFLFNIFHYALRPWPWILVALASLVIFPDLNSLGKAFPNISSSILRHDLAYSAMLTYLPAGLLGLVIASLIAAVMSTISTHLNWGASYIVNDFYKRFIKIDSSDRELVLVGRFSIVGLMILSAGLALVLSNALQAFHILLQIGAGTGLLFLLRWFWWRINAASEISAMIISFLVALYFEFIHTKLGFMALLDWQKLLIGIAVTTFGWITITLITKPTDHNTLFNFYVRIQPGGPGWKNVLKVAHMKGVDIDKYLTQQWDVPSGLVGVVLGIILVYSSLFLIGFWLYSNYTAIVISSMITVLSSVLLVRIWKNKLNAFSWKGN